MALLKKILIGLVVFFVLIGIVGFLILPPLIKPLICDKLTAALKRPVTIEKISINPYALSIIINGFKISEPDQKTPFVSFDELYLNLYGISSLFKRKLILEDVNLVAPFIGIARGENNLYNFSDLLPKEEAKPAPESKPFYFSVNNIRIIKGSVDFWDGPNQTKHTIRDMNLAIPAISNIDYYVKTYVEPKLSANINGHQFDLAGKTKPFLDSRETSFDVEIKDLDIPFYLKYVPVKTNFDLTSARLDAKLKINFVMQKGEQPVISLSGTAALKKIALDDKQKNKILRLPELIIEIASAEPLNADIHLAKVALKDIELVIKRSKNSEINLLNLIVPADKTKLTDEKTANKPAAPEKKNQLKLRVDAVELTASNVTFIDDVPAQQAIISIWPLRLKATNLSTEKNSKGDIDLFLAIAKKGEIAVHGQLGIDPLSAELALGVKNLGIRTFQPYFQDEVKVNVQHGAISTAGNLSLSVDEKGASRIKYAGKLYVSNLAVVDEVHANDFLNWKQLYFDQLQVGYNPFFVDIKGISLTDFYARIIVNADSTLNINNIFGKETEKKESKEVKEEPAVKTAEKTREPAKEDGVAKKIKIGNVTFQGGTIDFTDLLIKPNYSVRMLNMAGSVKGLSTDESSRASVNLKGNLGYGSPIEITGKINPLAKDLFADVKFDFQDIELSPVTPYSSKYLGYPITKGKLNFTVEYLIDKRKLAAKNKILIDQLTLGEKVESPVAIKAPVGLAVSLLTDRNGQINLDIPVSGSLDDPKFSVWPIVWQVIVNLITKALTAPFALLASLTGGGEELSYMEFDYGTSQVTADNQKKISALVSALRERPQLKMDIEGYADLENDREGLKNAEFQRRLKVQKSKELTAKGESSLSFDEMQIEPQEYEKYLVLAYNAEKFTKPRTAPGVQKKLPKEEMEKLMLTNIEVTNSDLRQLALRRAEKVKELILAPGEVKAGQIFIVEPPSLSPEKKEKVKESRVNFKLK